MTENLLPCPFCASLDDKGGFVPPQLHKSKHEGLYLVRCEVCHAGSAYHFRTPEAAANWWNTRAQPEAKDAWRTHLERWESEWPDKPVGWENSEARLRLFAPATDSEGEEK